MVAKQGISEAEYETWLSPRSALDFLRSAINSDYAVPEIIKRLRASILRSAAKIVLLTTYRDTQRSDFALILAAAWRPDGLMRPEHTLWATATFQCEMPSLNLSAPSQNFTFHGVRFDPKGLQEIFDAAAPIKSERVTFTARTATAADSIVSRLPGRPATLIGVTKTETPPPAPEPKKPRAGGRSLKPGWEAAINSIWKAIHEGFQPKKQKDIEDRLAQWFVDHDLEEPSLTQRRIRAQMIWGAYKSPD